MRLDSLAFRLFATAAAWTAIVLPLAGLLIFSLYRHEAEQSFDDRVRTLLTVIIADSLDHAGTEPGAPKDVGEPLFEITNSGWYWQIKPVEEILGRRRVSASLTSFDLPSPRELAIKPDLTAVRWMNGTGPLGQPLRIAEQIHSYGDEALGPQFSFIVAGPRDWLDARVTGFRNRLIISLALAGLGLLVATFLQVRFGLLPLKEIGRGLAAIRSGEAERLDSRLPVEIEPLQSELNALIESNQNIIERARTQVGNLAHALKTPLAVITNEARDEKSAFGQKVAEQAMIMRDQVTGYLDRARIAARSGSIGRVTEVRPVAEALGRALERINRDRGIVIEIDCPAVAKFQGEKHDLEEMLGNLMDNACKWATSRIDVRVDVREVAAAVGKLPQRRLTIAVDDDGSGLDDAQRRKLGKRGLRLDESKPGTGLGLSIVIDLAHSYRGTLALERSDRGGLSARLELPAA
jgi:signal transduction histidine kinase